MGIDAIVGSKGAYHEKKKGKLDQMSIRLKFIIKITQLLFITPKGHSTIFISSKVHFVGTLPFDSVLQNSQPHKFNEKWSKSSQR